MRTPGSERSPREPVGHAPRDAGHPPAARRTPGEEVRETPPLEWTAAAIGTAVVLLAVGYLLYEAVTIPSGPPAIHVRVESIAVTPTGYVVEFVAENVGNSTGANVVIEGDLVGETGIVESGRTTLNFVPSRSRRRGGLFFTRDPRRHRLLLSARGYEAP